MIATYYSRFDGAFVTVPFTPEANTADALTCAEAHADRIARRFALYAECDWQRASADPTNGPQEEEGPGDEPPIDWGNDRQPAPGALVSGEPAPQERAIPRFDGTLASYLARAQWAQAQARQRGMAHKAVA